MEKSRIWTHGLYNRLVKISPEFRYWLERDIIEVKKFLKKDHVVLDIGCGWGREIKELAPFCSKIIGIDNSPEEIETAKSYLKDVPNAELFLEDARRVRFPDGHFDVIISLGNTFGNLCGDKETVLKEIKRVVKKDGRILMSMHSKISDSKRAEVYRKAGMKIREIKNRRIVFEGGLVSEGFSKHELKEIFERFGLEARFIDICPISFLCDILLAA